MNQSKSGPGAQASAMRQFGWVALSLVALLAFLFRDGLLPGRTVFSNDGPLGAMSARCGDLPAGFFGFWNDLNWLGGTGPSASPTDRKSTRLNSSHLGISYAVFCLKKK